MMMMMTDRMTITTEDPDGLVDTVPRPRRTTTADDAGPGRAPGPRMVPGTGHAARAAAGALIRPLILRLLLPRVRGLLAGRLTSLPGPAAARVQGPPHAGNRRAPVARATAIVGAPEAGPTRRPRPLRLAPGPRHRRHPPDRAPGQRLP